jgi:hypothetical protein
MTKAHQQGQWITKEKLGSKKHLGQWFDYGLISTKLLWRPGPQCSTVGSGGSHRCLDQEGGTHMSRLTRLSHVNKFLLPRDRISDCKNWLLQSQPSPFPLSLTHVHLPFRSRRKLNQHKALGLMGLLILDFWASRTINQNKLLSLLNYPILGILL